MSGYFTCQACKDPTKLYPSDGPYEGVCETCYDDYVDWLMEPSNLCRRIHEWLDQKNELKPGSPDGAGNEDCSASN